MANNTYTADLRAMLDNDAIDRIPYCIIAHDNGDVSDDGPILVAGQRIQGTSSETGTLSAELVVLDDDSPSYYSLVVDDTYYNFQTRADDGTDIGPLVDLFYSRHPDGRVEVEYVPTLGPEGRQGVQGITGPAGPRGPQGLKGCLLYTSPSPRDS